MKLTFLLPFQFFGIHVGLLTIDVGVCAQEQQRGRSADVVKGARLSSSLSGLVLPQSQVSALALKDDWGTVGDETIMIRKGEGNRMLKKSKKKKDKKNKKEKSGKSKKKNGKSKKNDDVTTEVAQQDLGGGISVELVAQTKAGSSTVDVACADCELAASISPTELTLTVVVSESGETDTFIIPFAGDGIIVTPKLALQLFTFVLLQIKAAAAESQAIVGTGGRRRLDSPGCDLFPDASCNLGCCAVHDKCYADNDCSFLSWARNVCSGGSGVLTVLNFGVLGAVACASALLLIDGACEQCNAVAVSCIARGCSGIDDPPTSELCYDNKCDQMFECPGVCPFISLDDIACCGCQTPGVSCNSPATCGNGVCDFGESPSNCYTDCAYNTCPEPGQFDCAGTCVDPQTDQSNCGACGIVCPESSPCIAGKCSVPLSIEWALSDNNVSTGGWVVTENGLNLRFVVEDSANCGGSNSSVQSGTATAEISISEPYNLTPDITGLAELQDANFERMEVTLDGTMIATAESRNLDLGCAMGQIDLTVLVSTPILLLPGNHIFEVFFTTNDGLYHVNAFYEFNLAFAPASVAS